MAQLSDSIERFIKELMDQDSQVEVRRNELAQHFGCAPSQINYGWRLAFPSIMAI